MVETQLGEVPSSHHPALDDCPSGSGDTWPGDSGLLTTQVNAGELMTTPRKAMVRGLLTSAGKVEAGGLKPTTVMCKGGGLQTTPGKTKVKRLQTTLVKYKLRGLRTAPGKAKPRGLRNTPVKTKVGGLHTSLVKSKAGGPKTTPVKTNVGGLRTTTRKVKAGGLHTTQAKGGLRTTIRKTNGGGLRTTPGSAKEGRQTRLSNTKSTPAPDKKGAKLSKRKSHPKRIIMVKPIGAHSNKRKCRGAVQLLHCPECPFTTQRPTVMARHAPFHSQQLLGENEPKRSFTCTTCDFSCGYMWMLFAHRASAHSLPPARVVRHTPYTCPTCRYTCSKITMLKRHMMVHSQPRQHSCPYCPFTSNIKYSLKVHAACHSDEKPFKCKQCGACFNRLLTLRGHAATHSDLKPYKCAECNFACAYGSSLRRHRSVHAAHMLCCPACPFTCKLMATHLAHRVAAHGERALYACTLCTARLDSTRQLAAHLRQHKRTDIHNGDERQFLLPKFLVRIRNKKVKENKIGSVKELMIEYNRLHKEIGQKRSATLSINHHGAAAAVAKSRTGEVWNANKIPSSFLRLKVCVRKLTISEIIRGRVNS